MNRRAEPDLTGWTDPYSDVALDRGVTVAPAVFGAEPDPASETDLENAPVVFVPCEKVPQQHDSDIAIELFDGDDGTTLLVYSSLEALIDTCGEHQPWMCLPVTRLHELQQECSAGVVAWDAELPDEFRHNSAEEDQLR